MRYVPCLRWKAGEYQALSRLSRDASSAIVPLVDIPEIGYDFETRQEHKTIDEHLAKFDNRLAKTWGSAPCFIDLHLLDPGLRMANGDHPLTHVFTRLRAAGARAVPVVSLVSDCNHLRAAKAVVAEDGRGLCARVGIEEAASHDLKGRFDHLLGQAAANVQNCDLMLDLGAPSFEPMADFASLVETLILGLPYLRRWRSLTLLGTSFPSSLAGVPQGLAVVPRRAWGLYRLLATRSAIRRTRVPDFGDYAIGHPSVIQADLRVLKPSAAIRYTVEDGWLIAKGASVRVPGGYRQFVGLSQSIVSSRYYMGPEFSAGDRQIAMCATGNAGTGNLTTWRFVGTSHHIEKIVKDLATWRDP